MILIISLLKHIICNKKNDIVHQLSMIYRLLSSQSHKSSQLILCLVSLFCVPLCVYISCKLILSFTEYKFILYIFTHLVSAFYNPMACQNDQLPPPANNQAPIDSSSRMVTTDPVLALRTPNILHQGHHYVSIKLTATNYFFLESATSTFLTWTEPLWFCGWFQRMAIGVCDANHFCISGR